LPQVQPFTRYKRSFSIMSVSVARKLRPFITTTVLFSFIAISLTGVFLFFHVSPVGSMQVWKQIHEWLSIVFLVGALIHLAYNWRVALTYFKFPKSAWSWGLALVLCLGLVAATLVFPSKSGHGPGPGAPAQLERPNAPQAD
jgi:hypothetical protein